MYSDTTPGMSELIIDANTRIQILDTIPHLARARKHQYAAFVRSEGVLVVWADIVDNIIGAAEALEESLIHFIWRGEEENRKANQAIQIAEDEKKEALEDGEAVDTKEEDMDPEDVEMRRVKRHWRERPTRLIAPMIDGLGIIVCLAIIALGISEFSVLLHVVPPLTWAGTLVIEYMLDGSALRFVLVIFAPALCCVAAFAANCLVSSIVSLCLWPIHTNAKLTVHSGRFLGRLGNVPKTRSTFLDWRQKGRWGSSRTLRFRCRCTRRVWKRSFGLPSSRSRGPSQRESTRPKTSVHG